MLTLHCDLATSVYGKWGRPWKNARYWPSEGEARSGYPVVVVDGGEYGQLKVRHYVPGEWEAALEKAAGKP